MEDQKSETPRMSTPTTAAVHLLLKWFNILNWMTLFRDYLNGIHLKDTPVIEILGFRNPAREECLIAGMRHLIAERQRLRTTTDSTMSYLHHHKGFLINDFLENLEFQANRTRVYQRGNMTQFYPYRIRDEGILEISNANIPRNLIPENEKGYMPLLFKESVETLESITSVKPIFIGTKQYAKGIPSTIHGYFDSMCSERWSKYWIPDAGMCGRIMNDWGPGRLAWELIDTFSEPIFRNVDIFIEFFIPEITPISHTIRHYGSVFLGFFFEILKAKCDIEEKLGKGQQWIVVFLPFQPNSRMRPKQFEGKMQEYHLNKRIGKVLSCEIGVPFFPIDVFGRQHSPDLYSYQSNWATESNVLFAGINRTLEFDRRVLCELTEGIKIMQCARQWTSPV